MSTKGTVALIGNWHLYEEVFEQWNIYIDLPKDALTAIDGNDVTIRIPIAVWKELRQHTTHSERRIDQNLSRLREEAQHWVRDRLIDYERASTEAEQSVVALRGCLIADINDPMEKQIEDYIAHFTPPAQ